MPRTQQRPYDLTARQLTGEHADVNALTRWLTEELEHAIGVKSHVDADLDYWWRLYEQARTRLATMMPHPNAADLTSQIGVQYVDAIHARAMHTIFGVDKIWTVDGWGDSAAKAPFVEAFHSWAVEDERLQSYCDSAIFNAWIDSVGILECTEAIDYRPVRKTIKAALERDPLTGAAIFDEQHRPKLQRHGEAFIEVTPEDIHAGAPFAEQEIDSYEPVRVGPEYDVIDYKDFFVLPRHARSRKDVWGYAKRFYRRVPYLQEKAAIGYYDREALTACGVENERETTPDEAERGVSVAPQEGPTAELELYEIAFLRNLDGKGERWWVAVVHVARRQLLRLKYDDLGTQIGFGRFVRFIPYPRKGSIEAGYSIIGHKLITQIEEHTAIRNMRADRSGLAAAAPIKRLHTALWNQDEQPFAPGISIDVREMNELEAMEIPDVPESVNVWERTVLDAAERTIGMSDVSTGIEPDEERTATERRLTAGYSEVRTNLLIRRLQEPLEDLAQIRHIIWKRTLAQRGPEGMPASVVSGLEQRGYDVSSLQNGEITADLLEGKFTFKPYGSTETADRSTQRKDFTEFLGVLPALFQLNAIIAAMFQTPDAARALIERGMDLHGWKDKQAILGPVGQSAMGTAAMLHDPRIQQAVQPMMGSGPGSAPGMTDGMTGGMTASAPDPMMGMGG